MQGFTPQNRKKESMQGNTNKPAHQITPKKTPSAQAQAMNQQPDSVPAMVKPGEYVLPADTVDAVGGQQALDGVVQATHTQAPNTAVVPQGFEPQYFFAQGGVVPDEETRSRLVAVPPSMGRRENTTFAPPAPPAPPPRPARDPGIASAAMALPQDNAPTFASMAAQGKSTPPMPVAAPLSAPTQPTPSEMGVAVPPSPDNIFPGNRLNGASGFSGAPIRNSDLTPVPVTPPVARDPAVTSAAMGLPQDNGHEMFSTPQMRASLSVPKPPAPPAPQPDPMAGMAATGFNPNITAKAERPPAGVPSAPPKSNAGVYMGNPSSPTALFVSDASAEAGKLWDQGDLAGAAGAALRTGAGAIGMGAAEALDNTVGAAARGIWDGGGRFIGGLIGSQAQATPATAPAAPGAAAAANPAAARANTAASAPATATAAAPAATGSTTGQSGEQLPSGVYQHGRGQYSDNAQGMGFSPGFTGRPNAQNLNAASNLSAQSMRDSAARVMAQPAGQPQVGGFRAPTVNTSANDFTTREALRRAKMDASSLIHSSSWAPKGSGQAAQARYNQMQQADLAAQAQQGTMDMQAMGFNAGMAREQLQQDGALQRTLIGQNSDAARLGLEERRLAGEETARGFQTRQGQRLEQAQTAYLNAKTPEEQASALATMRALSGNDDSKGRYITTGGGQVWDSKANATITQPQRIFDTQTKQYVDSGVKQDAPAAPQSAKERKAGTIYTLPNGQQMRWSGSAWELAN